MTKRRAPRNLVFVLLGLVAFTTLAWADLSSVRYHKSGSSHYFLSTHDSVRIGDREASISVYLLAGRYVALYTESKRRSASESEVLLQRELAGSFSGSTLGGLGTLRLTTQTKNGKPVVELVLGQAVSATPQGTVMRLAWTGGSYAPKSVQ